MPTMIEHALRDTLSDTIMVPDTTRNGPMRGLAIGIALGLCVWCAAGWLMWLLTA